MMSPIRAVLAALALASGSAAVHAAEPIIFESIDTLPQEGMDAKVIGGIPVDVSKWPATSYQFRPAGTRACTLTLVGPRAVILAAHCLIEDPDPLKLSTPTLNRDIRILDRKSQTIVEGKCTEHPKYMSSQKDGCSDTDLALCALDADIEIAGPYETINVDPNRAKVGTRAFLLGYGCIKREDTKDTSNNPRAPILYGAATTLQDRTDPKNPSYLIGDSEVVICQGDSGGGVYVSDAGVDAIETTRSLIAVNSCNNDPRNASFLVDTSAPSSIEFIRDWSSRSGNRVCGVTLSGEQCRQP